MSVLARIERFSVPRHLTDQLITYLAQARDLERLDLRLLDQGVTSAKDDAVRDIYRSHERQTAQQLASIEELLNSRVAAPAAGNGHGVAGALEIAFAADAAHTPTQLAISAYAFENLEIAVYHLLGHLAERCDDRATAAVVARILEEEEQTAELLAATFDRALAASLET
ncbi:MAG: DUF892 family protein [Solirubrobacterales bacterium]|nr:DUF892 family protein [Solirubrobacterales bacterium]